MKVRDTSPGRLYALSSEIGCTAINGAMAVDIPAGGQVVVLALDKKIVIDGDDAAKFVEVRWGTNTVVGSRPVPAWLSDVLAGLISIVGDDNFDINYMPAENKLIVHTDRVDDTTLEAVTDMLERFVPADIEVVQYNHHIEILPENINKYANCTTVQQMYAVDPEKFELGKAYGSTLYYVKDLTSDGDFVYPLPKLREATAGHWVYGGFFKYVRVKKFKISLPSATNLAAFINANQYIEELEFSCADGANFLYSQYNCPKLRKVSFTGAPHGIREAWIKNYKMEEIYGDFSKVSDASGAFNGCILNAESAIRVLTGLPTFASGSHLITIGIHVDHKNDEEVRAAIDAASAKGWTVVEQWNGTATASTASTLALWDEEETNPIYARIVEAPEYGDYVTPEGARVIIDWGHLVTSPDGKTPEEMGYEQYVSIGEVMYKHNLSYYTEPIETGN